MAAVVASGWAVLLRCGSIWKSPTAPWAPYFSRVEIRLLRDTRRELEYLPKGGRGQPFVYVSNETTKPDGPDLTASRVYKCCREGDQDHKMYQIIQMTRMIKV